MENEGQEQSTEVTSATATTEEAKAPTLAEVEKQWQEDTAKAKGWDMAKRFPGAIKTEVKPEAKVEEKVETKPAETERPKPKTGFGRQIRKIVDRETAPLKAEIARLQSQVKPTETKVETKTEELTEPKVEDFKKIEDWVVAIRAYDKKVAEAEKAKVSESNTTAESQQQWNAAVERYNSQLADVRKNYADWDQVQSKDVNVGREGDAEYNSLMGGILMQAGPETVYHLMKEPASARGISKIDPTGLVAISNSDDMMGVILHFAKNPEDVVKINGMNPVKAQAFVGKIEAKIESDKAKAEADKKRSSTGSTATSTEVDKGEVATEVKEPTRSRPEPPPPLRGKAVPSVDDWRDPSDMSLAERERHFYDDPRNKRR